MQLRRRGALGHFQWRGVGRGECSLEPRPLGFSNVLVAVGPAQRPVHQPLDPRWVQLATRLSPARPAIPPNPVRQADARIGFAPRIPTPRRFRVAGRGRGYARRSRSFCGDGGRQHRTLPARPTPHHTRGRQDLAGRLQARAFGDAASFQRRQIEVVPLPRFWTFLSRVQTWVQRFRFQCLRLIYLGRESRQI
jgi:hypothetical protein